MLLTFSVSPFYTPNTNSTSITTSFSLTPISPKYNNSLLLNYHTNPSPSPNTT